MRKQFTLLTQLLDKNIYRLFAGGNHSWILLDEIIPVKKNHRPSSPLASDKALLNGQEISPAKDATGAADGIRLQN